MAAADRKRVSIACTTCRKRKRRCDGQKPQCGLCEKESRQCEYAHHLEKRKPPTKCYIHALHSRISLLEEQLALSHGGMKSSSAPSSILEDSSSPDMKMQISPSSIPPQGPHGLPFLGLESRSSSSYGHLSLLGRFDDLPSNTHQREIQIIDGLLFIKGLACPAQPGLQDQLLEEFWTWHNTWPPLVHEDLFRKDMSANGAIGYCTSTLLTSLLALSTHSTDPLELDPTTNDSKEARTTLYQHSKSSVLEDIEYPSISLVISAAIVARMELLLENIASASQFIGIAIRHAMTLGLHRETSSVNDSIPGSTEIVDARRIAWAGSWMLEKHICRILGQASAVKESENLPILVPILPTVEYGLWPATENSAIPKLTSYSMSNFQLSCDLLHIVTPALETVYAISSSVSPEETETLVTKIHVAMSEFYNNLPSPLRLPQTATKQLPPHVYQFSLLYQTLKIMLHSPFICGAPTMESLHSSQDPHLVHIQSATFSAIRVSYIISSFRNFYPLHRLSPMAVESLVVASRIHLFNSRSDDERLARRSIDLYSLNYHILNLMTSSGRKKSRAAQVLTSLSREYGLPATSTCGERPTLGSRAALKDIGSEAIPPHMQSAAANPADSSTPMGFDDPQKSWDSSINVESYFDWLDLPLNEQLLFNGALGDTLWNDPCEEGHEYCRVPENYF